MANDLQERSEFCLSRPILARLGSALGLVWKVATGIDRSICKGQRFSTLNSMLPPKDSGHSVRKGYV